MCVRGLLSQEKKENPGSCKREFDLLYGCQIVPGAFGQSWARDLAQALTLLFIYRKRLPGLIFLRITSYLRALMNNLGMVESADFEVL